MKSLLLLLSFVFLSIFVSNQVFALDFGDSLGNIYENDAPVQILDVSRSSFSLSPSEEDQMILTLVNLSDKDKKISLDVVDSVNGLGIVYEQEDTLLGNVDEVLRKYLYTNTPVQILDVSQSSFKMSPSEKEEMILTLVNLSDKDKTVFFDVVDSTNGRKLLYKSRYDVKEHISTWLKHKKEVEIKGNSILRVPFRIDIPEDVNPAKFYGAVLLSPVDEIDTLWNVRAVQPLEIQIEGPGILNRVGDIIWGFLFTRYILVIGLFILIAFSLFLHKRISSRKAFLVISFTLIVSTLFSITIYNYYSGIQKIIGDIQTNILESDSNATLDVDLGSTLDTDLEEFFEIDSASTVDVNLDNYEFKSEEGLSYLEEYGIVIEGSLESVATPSVDWYSGEYGGVEAPIIKGEQPDYAGIELNVLDVLRNQHIEEGRIKRYVRDVLMLEDGGAARNDSKKICRTLNAPDFSSMNEVLENVILELLRNEVGLDENKVSEFVKVVMRESTLYHRLRGICVMAKTAHSKAIKIMESKEVGRLAILEETRLLQHSKLVELLLAHGKSNIIDLIVQYAATEDVLQLLNGSAATADVAELLEILGIPYEESFYDAEEISYDTEEISYDIDGTSYDLEETDKSEEDKEDLKNVRRFEVYDQEFEETDELDEKIEDELALMFEVDEPEPEPVAVVDLDLTESGIVEMFIPNYIQLPPIDRRPEAFISKLEMGNFQIRTFKEEQPWQGYFSFGSIDAGTNIFDNMWLEVNSLKLDPYETYGDTGKFINYYISDEFFPKLVEGDYKFAPSLWVLVPENVIPRTYSTNIEFTLIQ